MPESGSNCFVSLGEGVVPSPAFGDGLIFTASGFGDSTLRTVRPGGLGDVTKSHVAWEQRKGTPSQSSLLYVKPFLYGISEGGTATCYRAESGEVVWQKRLDGSYCSSPVYAEGHIYFLSEQGQTTVLASGERFEVLAKNPLNEKCQASMAVSNQSLFIRTEKHLWCVGK